MGSPINETNIDKPPRLPKSAPKVRLTIVSGPGVGNVVELTRCVSIIGSKPGCKLRLKSAHVSAVHCAIVNTGEEVLLRDLASSNGTFRHDLPAVVETLRDDDRIRVGDWVFRVGITAYTLDTLSDLPHVSLEPEPSAFCVEVNGNGNVARLKRSVGIVGRRDGCDIVLKDRRVSRVHMLLFTYAGQPAFCDLLSNNGIVHEGVRSQFGFLQSADTLLLGGFPVRMILPGIGKRKPASSGGSDGAGGGSGSRSQVLAGQDSGTVVPMDDDDGDRIDIRTAEIDGR